MAIVEDLEFVSADRMLNSYPRLNARQFKSEVKQLFKAGGKGNLEIGQA